MKFIADFHIHSKYSRATSTKMNIQNLAKFAKMKGISLLGTGDFTHPLWLAELKKELTPLQNGLFKHKDTYFILTTEICNIFTKNNQLKRIHNMIFAPTFEVIEKINQQLVKYGHLSIDGRPMLHLSAANLVKIVFDISDNCLIVPAHIWTPWFSLFGSHSGFDIIEDCFEDQTENIFCLETGLSSDPAMNWQLSCLDKYTLISNSDAHSLQKIGRETNVFDTQIDYFEIIQILKEKDKSKFLFTIEFFPQEGKYHYDGHRACNICFSPKETKKNNNCCPKCGKSLTIGVMNRIEKLADRDENYVPSNAIPFKKLIPLLEIIAESLNIGESTVTVEKEYMKLVSAFDNEFEVLLNVPYEKLVSVVDEKIAKGIISVRKGNVHIYPGYDGVFGKIKIFDEEKQEETEQLNLF